MKQVEAVKTAEQRTQVEAQLLEAGQLYYDIWKIGLNTALRISDLLSLTMDDVRKLDPAAPALNLVEIKTGKPRKIMINQICLQVVEGYQRVFINKDLNLLPT